MIGTSCSCRHDTVDDGLCNSCSVDRLRLMNGFKETYWQRSLNIYR